MFLTMVSVVSVFYRARAYRTLSSFSAQMRIKTYHNQAVSVYDSAFYNTIVPTSSIQLKPQEQAMHETGLVLHCNREEDNRVELRWGQESERYNKEKPFYIDFDKGPTLRRLKQSHSEAVFKAFGSPDKHDLICDFTAGLGRDASLLAAGGHTVICFERNVVMYLLLQDALKRCSSNREVFDRMSLHLLDVTTESNSVQECIAATLESKTLQNKDTNASVGVYLDPMYPLNEVGKKAAVKKETQILHRMVGQSSSDKTDRAMNDLSLLNTALTVATSKVVVKRPINAQPLGERKAQGMITGSTHRFDIYTPNYNM